MHYQLQAHVQQLYFEVIYKTEKYQYTYIWEFIIPQSLVVTFTVLVDVIILTVQHPIGKLAKITMFFTVV